IYQRGQRRAAGGPFQDTLGGWHESDAALAVFTKKPEIRRGIADAEHPLPFCARPALPDATVDQLPRHDPEALRIEVAEIDDIDAHDTNLTRPFDPERADYCIARSTLTPYLCGVATA